jgi:hypothetical protein
MPPITPIVSILYPLFVAVVAHYAIKGQYHGKNSETSFFEPFSIHPKIPSAPKGNRRDFVHNPLFSKFIFDKQGDL